jgi:hypothetical protein
MTVEERDEHGLPRNFNNVQFEIMDEFLRERPAIDPPHARDFQHPQGEHSVSVGGAGNPTGRKQPYFPSTQTAADHLSEDKDYDDIRDTEEDFLEDDIYGCT